MSDVSDIFWLASLEEIKRGYIYKEEKEEYICLMCGKSFENGIIYPCQDRLLTAEKYIRVHIENEHNSPFYFLLGLSKKLTGLTEHQKEILELFYEGYNDNDVAKKMGTGSTSTIRNHRFNLKEKHKQAKVLLAIMELLGEKMLKKTRFIDVPLNTKQVDARFAVTQQENDIILADHFKQGLDGPLTKYPLKEKKRVVILRQLVRCFEAGRKYSEKEINAVLGQYYHDYVLLRRHLIDYGFIERTTDGNVYWVKV